MGRTPHALLATRRLAVVPLAWKHGLADEQSTIGTLMAGTIDNVADSACRSAGATRRGGAAQDCRTDPIRAQHECQQERDQALQRSRHAALLSLASVRSAPILHYCGPFRGRFRGRSDLNQHRKACLPNRS